MTVEERIEAQLNELGGIFSGQESIVEGVMERIAPLPEVHGFNVVKPRYILIARRLIMSRFTKFAAAAAILLGVILAATTTDNAAYAIDQTIRASHGVRYIHIKDFKFGESDPKEFRVAFSEDGSVKAARLDFPGWASADGRKTVVWQENKARVWFREKNSLMTVRDDKVSRDMLRAVEVLDPRLTVAALKEQEAKGNAVVEIDEKGSRPGPIILTITYPDKVSGGGSRRVIQIDRDTKLVKSIELQIQKGDGYERYSVTEYHGYNEPIEEAVFSLDSELPSDIVRIDQSSGDIGMEKGRLSEEEVAKEVVRGFLEALAAEDYDKAGRLYSGISGKFLQERLGGMKVLGIVSIGTPSASGFNNSLKVPCKYEVEVGGARTTNESNIYVRPVHGRENLWCISGGF